MIYYRTNFETGRFWKALQYWGFKPSNPLGRKHMLSTWISCWKHVFDMGLLDALCGALTLQAKRERRGPHTRESDDLNIIAARSGDDVIIWWNHQMMFSSSPPGAAMMNFIIGWWFLHRRRRRRWWFIIWWNHQMIFIIAASGGDVTRLTASFPKCKHFVFALVYIMYTKILSIFEKEIAPEPKSFSSARVQKSIFRSTFELESKNHL